MKTILLCLLSFQIQAADSAVLHVYRDRAHPGAWRKFPVLMDGVQVLDITNGKHISLRVPAGAHLFSSKEKKESTSINMEAGKAYYVQAEIWMGFAGHWRIKQMSAEQAELDMKRLERESEKNVMSVAQSWIVAVN